MPARMLSKNEIAALEREAQRLELATILQFRPSHLKLLGLTPIEARAIIEAPATRAVDRWARQTRRGRRPSVHAQSAQVAMLAVHFLLSERITVSRAITGAFHACNRALHDDKLPINSTTRKAVRRLVDADMARLKSAGLRSNPGD